MVQSIIRWPIFILFEMNSLDFQNSYEIFQFFFETLKNERNVMNFGYFLPRFNITLKTFLDDWTNSFTVIASIFLLKMVSKNI